MSDHDQLVRQWLIALGALCSAQGHMADAQAKLRIYTPHLAHEFPAAAFTDDALRHVARRCKFFPSFSEVCNALGEHWRNERPARAIPGPTRAKAHEAEGEYILPPPPAWCFNRGLRGEDNPHADDEAASLKRIADILQGAKMMPKTAKHLTAAQLDQLNPLPNGFKRVTDGVDGGSR